MVIKNLLSRNFYRFFIVTLAILFSSCASQKFRKNIKTELKEAPEFQHGFVGFALYDPASKKMLVEYNAQKYFTPASNTKLFTFFTGLKMLGDSIPALKYKKISDTLYFKGTGDPSFLNPDLPDSKVYRFLKQNGPLVYVLPNYKETYLGPGWAWDDYNDYYSAERNDFPVYGSLVHFKFDKTGKLQKISPEIFKDSISFLASSEEKPLIKRALQSNHFDISLKNEEKEKWIPIKYSEKTLMDLLSDTLSKPITVKQEAPEKLDQTLYSIPSDSLYKQMLHVSDNFIAEQILLMVSDKISDSLKTEIAIDYMKKNYLKDLPDEPIWVDGSGLSRYNLFTPRTMVALLEKIKNEMPEEKLYDLLPSGGVSGTLKNYYKAEEPYIYAKTGSMSNNHSLSGYLITKSGKTFIFSFMNSNFTIPSSSLKKEMAKILEMVRDNF
ncbi:D-alanyl-D-alanine carboxypeptidase/D-alanyl-D-alanine-endopeptidase [Christiangramia fulva]|uniref:D-alanyl-D-alanine carboxypeptidase/D-alanyl-D-alanine-endopeptidase n=1 Tax=Christiangramia fulva TaxID=2126553 RepID=A0A2R3Z1E0_9FLAO|nr:D-alanyl-D-alanine carboxypeptidase/D-alanyl-D-alanine-endopeptidase [Christiangramia fulva]AVR44081.1 D-alanyl-D-alanine carboxypeptidase/D-alanyl-D-alanine-endopeptidase [Christiangramia fulva]